MHAVDGGHAQWGMSLPPWIPMAMRVLLASAKPGASHRAGGRDPESSSTRRAAGRLFDHRGVRQNVVRRGLVPTVRFRAACVAAQGRRGTPSPRTTPSGRPSGRPRSAQIVAERSVRTGSILTRRRGGCGNRHRGSTRTLNARRQSMRASRACAGAIPAAVRDLLRSAWPIRADARGGAAEPLNREVRDVASRGG